MFVLVNQFYPPDIAPTGRYLHDLAQQLVKQGHEVTVIASRHAYDGGGSFPALETLDGVRVVRLPGSAFGRGTYAGKLADYAAYYAGTAAKLLSLGPRDVVLALTTPPFVGLLAKLMAARSGARHAHWVMDVYPDVMSAHGMVSGVPLRALRALARYQLAGASAVITLGPSMARRLQPYVARPELVSFVPLWALSDLSPYPSDAIPLRAERGWEGDATVFMYSGNLGLGHRFSELLEAARRLGPTGPRFVFAGGGRNASSIEEFIGANPKLPIQLLPYAPEERLAEHLSSADVHLVSLDSRFDGMLLPSKLQASFAVGRPVIFVGSAHQDIARWIEESGGGWAVGQDDVDALLRAIEAARDDRERKRRGEAALRFARERFDRDRNVQAMLDLLELRAPVTPCRPRA